MRGPLFLSLFWLGAGLVATAPLAAQDPATKERRPPAAEPRRDERPREPAAREGRGSGDRGRREASPKPPPSPRSTGEPELRRRKP